MSFEFLKQKSKLNHVFERRMHYGYSIEFLTVGQTIPSSFTCVVS